LLGRGLSLGGIECRNQKLLIQLTESAVRELGAGLSQSASAHGGLLNESMEEIMKMTLHGAGRFLQQQEQEDRKGQSAAPGECSGTVSMT
jgi:hypothetical protein